MFLIQYEAVSGEHKIQQFDSNSRDRLAAHLARFSHPIIAVYEQSTTITKAMREMLRGRKDLLKDARNFTNRA